MGIKSNKQQGRIYVSPLSIQGEIIVLSGSPVQTYDKQLREYSPDRTLTPLVIVPKVSAFDEKTVFGEMELTGVEWFEGAPRDKSANRIVEGGVLQHFRRQRRCAQIRAYHPEEHAAGEAGGVFRHRDIHGPSYEPRGPL